jgi:adenylylsulfate kinase
MKVTKSRSLVKSFSYRVFGTLTSFAVVYVITGKGSLATLIAIWETIIKVGVYYWHERLWDRVSWGRKVGDNDSKE